MALESLLERGHNKVHHHHRHQAGQHQQSGHDTGGEGHAGRGAQQHRSDRGRKAGSHRGGGEQLGPGSTQVVPEGSHDQARLAPLTPHAATCVARDHCEPRVAVLGPVTEAQHGSVRLQTDCEVSVELRDPAPEDEDCSLPATPVEPFVALSGTAPCNGWEAPWEAHAGAIPEPATLAPGGSDGGLLSEWSPQDLPLGTAAFSPGNKPPWGEDQGAGSLLSARLHNARRAWGEGHASAAAAGSRGVHALMEGAPTSQPLDPERRAAEPTSRHPRHSSKGGKEPEAAASVRSGGSESEEEDSEDEEQGDIRSAIRRRRLRVMAVTLTYATWVVMATIIFACEPHSWPLSAPPRPQLRIG